MDQLDLIKEESFPAKDKPWLKKFFPTRCLERDWYAHCIYTDFEGEIKLIWGSVSDCLEDERGNGFKHYIKKRRSNRFYEILLLLDLYTGSLLKESDSEPYPIDPATITNQFIQVKSSMGEVVTDLLKESKGIILWHYQFENLLNLFIMDRADVLSIRKGINTKEVSVFNRLERFHIDGSLTLIDFIMDRMYLGHTVYPNIRGAYLLYDLLKQDPQQIE
jgi:hypothetical protein